MSGEPAGKPAAAGAVRAVGYLRRGELVRGENREVAAAMKRRNWIVPHKSRTFWETCDRSGQGPPNGERKGIPAATLALSPGSVKSEIVCGAAVHLHACDDDPPVALFCK